MVPSNCIIICIYYKNCIISGYYVPYQSRLIQTEVKIYYSCEKFNGPILTVWIETGLYQQIEFGYFCRLLSAANLKTLRCFLHNIKFFYMDIDLFLREWHASIKGSMIYANYFRFDNDLGNQKRAYCHVSRTDQYRYIYYFYKSSSKHF